MNCPKCGGKGIVPKSFPDGLTIQMAMRGCSIVETCPLCHGSGCVPNDYVALKKLAEDMLDHLFMRDMEAAVKANGDMGFSAYRRMQRDEFQKRFDAMNPDCPAAKALEEK